MNRESGSVVRDTTGFNGGSPSQLTVSYSPQYNSISSIIYIIKCIAIDNSGNLTLGVHISGSSTGSGDTISSTITFRDQFDNIGSGSITVNVFKNQAPTTFVRWCKHDDIDLKWNRFSKYVNI